VETKHCQRCDHRLTVDQFSKHRGRPDGLQAYCKGCYRKANDVIRQRHALVEHRAPDQKRCGQCGETKAGTAFYRDRYRPDGLSTNCRACHRRNTDNWKRANPNAVRKIAEASYRRHADARRAAARAYSAANSERVRARHAEWKRNNRARATALETIRRGRKAGAPGNATPDQVAARVAYFGGRCWMCAAPWEQIDHVKPLAAGGSNWPANLRPACARCNVTKGGRWPLETSRRTAG
jgi:hypothetical protein